MSDRSREKLTAAQKRTLQAVAAGHVHMHFDVWGGYWWTEHGKRLPCYGKSEHFPPLPIRALLDTKRIERGEPDQIGSGWRRYPYSLTDLGRATLTQEPKP